MTPVEILSAINTGSANNYTATFSGSAAIGDAAFVCICHDTSGTLPASMTDSVGNVFTRSAAAPGTGGLTVWDTTRRMGLYYCLSLTAAIVGGTTTITFTTGGSSHKELIGWKAVGGVFTVDKANHNDSQASTATPTTGSTGVLASAVELAFAAYGYESNPSFTPPASWSQTATTQQTVNGSACSMSVCYLDVAATTALNPSPTLGAAQISAGLIATFSYVASGSRYAPALTPAAIDVCANDMPGAYLQGPGGSACDRPLVGVGV